MLNGEDFLQNLTYMEGNFENTHTTKREIKISKKKKMIEIEFKNEFHTFSKKMSLKIYESCHFPILS